MKATGMHISFVVALFQLSTDTVGVDLTGAIVDYAHGNAIEVDGDGNLILSSRHFSEVTKINRLSGEIMWRWGGKNNQFTFIGDSTGFSYQHTIRRLPAGRRGAPRSRRTTRTRSTPRQSSHTRSRLPATSDSRFMTSLGG